MVAFSPGTQLLQARRRLVGQLTDDGRVEEGLDLDGPGEIELLRFGLGCLVPLLEDFGESGAIDLYKLLQLV